MKYGFALILVTLAACIAFTCWRFWQILPLPRFLKSILIGIYLLCFLAVFAHYKWGGHMPMPLATVTYVVGASWMIFFVYALIIFAVLSIGQLIHVVPDSFMKDSTSGTCTVLGIICLTLIYGNIHYHHKYREVIDITTAKPIERPLTVVMASDLHVGYHNRKTELSRWVDLFNAEKPDMVLIAGDILDGELRPVLEMHMEEEFRKIDAPVFACLGNHEYIAGTGGSASFFEAAGINVLRDSVISVNGIRIVGRDDRSNKTRHDLRELIQDDSLYTVLLDHQPYHLEEAEECRVDFQFSGHTHHGQIWPGNWITDAIYEKAFGHHQRGDTRYYVSSGLGIWGGRFRIGTRSEYIVLKIHN